MNEEKEFLLRQERFYWNSDFKWSRWYRKALGGTWYLYKFGRDTPAIRMFSTWTKLDDVWEGHKTLLLKETHPVTSVCSWFDILKYLIR